MEAWIVVVRHRACPRYPVQNPALLCHRGAKPIPASQSMQTQNTGATILSVVGNGFFRLGHHGGAWMDRQACLTNVLHAGQQALESETSP